MNYKDYSPIVLRFGISFVFLWFGLNQLFNAVVLVSRLAVRGVTFVMFNRVSKWWGSCLY